MPDDLIDLATVPEPTGYSTHDTYFASRYRQGGRFLYSVDVSVPELVSMVPAPDPDEPEEGNRKITPGHARGFSEYVLSRRDWVCPPLLLRAPEGEFTFTPIKTIQGTEFGILGIPKLARNSLNIVDGQHRVLGFHLAWSRLDSDIKKSRDHLARAKANGEDPALIAEADQRVKQLLRLRQQTAEQRIGLDILVVDNPRDYKQIFVDIADNAKGISRAVSVRFDTRRVVNRALDEVSTHPVLAGRIDEHSDRISKNSRYLMGAKHVADVIRAAQVGTGRISKRLEDELTDSEVIRNSWRFLDTLVQGFPDLKALQDGDTSPEELRSRSLLGSAVMIRALAGAYYELTVKQDHGSEPRMSAEGLAGFFASLAPFMSAPVQPTSPWMGTECFIEGNMAPSGGQGVVSKLTRSIIEWAENPPGWL